MTDKAVSLVAFLASEGYVSKASRDAARAVLHAAGLSNPRKSAISEEKLTRCRAVMRKALVRSCGLAACDELLSSREPHKLLVAVADAHCEHCAGARNRRAGMDLAHRCRAAGVSRVLVVGGRLASQRELEAALRGVDVDFVDGTTQQDAKVAGSRMARASVVVIWGNTPLDHSVSALYRRPPPGTALVLVPTRGAASVLAALDVHLARRSSPS